MVSRRLREHTIVARVGHRKASGAVGALGPSCGKAGLTEKRGLLIAGNSGDREGRAQERRTRLGDNAGRVDNLGQDRARNLEGVEQRVRPVSLNDVVEERAAGIRRVGDVYATIREFPYKPTVDCSACELTTLRAGPRLRDVIKEPGELRGREVRVQKEACAVTNLALEAVGAQRSQMSAVRLSCQTMAG